MGGADRIELNSALEAGGLTPTLGCLIEAKERVSIPIIAMIRPRTGGFCYTDAEFEVMKRDAALMLEHGADGIAIGILNEDRTVDRKRISQIISICKGREVVFHRAIDITPNLLDSIEELIELGVTRILTSGGRQRCLEGIETINAMQKQSNGRVQILACGSIRPTNLEEILSKTCCTHFHMALMKECCDLTMCGASIKFNGAPSEDRHKMIDRDQVEAASKIVH